jgi:hypothetical protein
MCSSCGSRSSRPVRESRRASRRSGRSWCGGASVVGEGHNEVWHRTDPTAHAEVVCIQNAARALKTIDLSGCVMYTTTEPCPMCASAIHWSKLDAVYFGARIADADDAGFSEIEMPIERLYGEGRSPVRAYAGGAGTGMRGVVRGVEGGEGAGVLSTATDSRGGWRGVRARPRRGDSRPQAAWVGSGRSDLRGRSRGCLAAPSASPAPG